MTISRNLSFLAEGVSSTGVLGATYGGTGQSSITTGDLLYGSASNTISKLAIGSTGTVLRVVAGVPSWGTDYVGTVTSVAALTLGTTGTDLSSTVANGTTTPVITLNVPTASATNRGVLSSTDWTTFNNKGSGSVTSVAATVPSFLSISGSPITTSGTLAITYSGTALPIANGGTAQTSFTSNQVLYGSFSQSANLIFDGSNFGVGVTPSAWSGFRATQIGSTTSLWSGATAGSNSSSFYTNNGYFNGSSRIYLTNGNASEYIMGAGLHIWYTAPSGTAGNAITFTEAMRIHASTGVSIGNTTDPGAGLLSVSNGVRINSTAGIVYGTGEYLSIATSTGGVGAALAGTNTTCVLGIWNKGTSSPTFQQFAQGTSGLPCGSISYNGALTVYATTSDQRLKTDLGVSQDTSVIDNTIIHDFTWSNGVVDRGVFAQEAYKIKPTAIQVGDDSLSKNGDLLKPWGVDYSAYVPDLIVKCQQQDKVINALLQRITALEQK